MRVEVSLCTFGEMTRKLIGISVFHSCLLSGVAQPNAAHECMKVCAFGCVNGRISITTIWITSPKCSTCIGGQGNVLSLNSVKTSKTAIEANTFGNVVYWKWQTYNHTDA